MAEIPEFGTKQPGASYLVRPSVYGIACDRDGRVLVVRTAEGAYLPGGGIDPGESPIEALHREFREEAGLQVAIGELLGVAHQYCGGKNGVPFLNKHSTFYAVQLLGATPMPADAGHELIWSAIADAYRTIRHESQFWGIREALSVKDRERACRPTSSSYPLSASRHRGAEQGP